VPAEHAVEDFAHALRSIGEPLFGRPARDISMGNVLAQLFEVTRLFDMQTRPELLLLQKTMVTVEGVARALDPELDMWATAEPVVSAWVRREAGPLGQMEKAVEILGDLARTLPKIPALIDRYEALLEKAEREQARRPAYLSPWFVALATLALLAVAAAAIASIF
jgi:ubiquinone biosynthesis protein